MSLAPIRRGMAGLYVFSDSERNAKLQSGMSCRSAVRLEADMRSRELIPGLADTSFAGRSVAFALAHEMRNSCQHLRNAVAHLDSLFDFASNKEGARVYHGFLDEHKRLVLLISNLLELGRGSESRSEWFYLNDAVQDVAEMASLVAGKMSGRRGELMVDTSRLSPECGRPANVSRDDVVKQNYVWGGSGQSRGKRPDVLQGHPVCASVGMVKQIVLNLLANAVEASSVGRRSRVELASQYQHGEFTVTVKDYGKGFDPTLSEKIFEQRGSFTKGSGLGRWGARRVAESLGGSLAGSSGGHRMGAEFTLTLPERPVPPKNTIRR